MAPVWGRKKNPNTKEQKFTTDLNTPMKQRPLCARVFCSKSTLEKFEFIFFSSILYQRVKKEKTFPHFCSTTKVIVSFVITLKVQNL